MASILKIVERVIWVMRMVWMILRILCIFFLLLPSLFRLYDLLFLSVYEFSEDFAHVCFMFCLSRLVIKSELHRAVDPIRNLIVRLVQELIDGSLRVAFTLLEEGLGLGH